MSIISNHWNEENDAAINSPGDKDQIYFSKHSLQPNTEELTNIKDKTLEYNLYGTVLNSL